MIAELIAPRYYAENGGFKKEVENNWRTDSYQRDNVAVIMVDGVLSSDCWYDDANVNSLKNLLETAIADENIGAILLHINSPGGEVKGIYAFANAIYNSPKKVIAYCEEACSGALWVCSQASIVYACDDITQTIGSVGVYSRHIDKTEQMKIDGIKVTEIVSQESPYKTIGTPFAPFSEDAQKYFQNHVDGIYTSFVNALQKGRGAKLQKQALDGQVFTPAQAKEYGLIDKIGSFEDAFAKAKEYATKNTQTTKTKIFYNMSKSNFPMLAAFMSLFAKNTKDAPTPNTENPEEQMEKILTESANAYKELEKVQTENQNFLIENEQMKNQLLTLQTENERLKTENEKLGKMPADNPTNIPPVTFDPTTTNSQKLWEKASHNKGFYAHIERNKKN